MGECVRVWVGGGGRVEGVDGGEGEGMRMCGCW